MLLFFYKNWIEEKWLIESSDYEAYHIVDGQQRLTTFIILVNSIVSLAEKENIDYLNNLTINLNSNNSITNLTVDNAEISNTTDGYVVYMNNINNSTDVNILFNINT